LPAILPQPGAVPGRQKARRMAGPGGERDSRDREPWTYRGVRLPLPADDSNVDAVRLSCLVAGPHSARV